MQIRLDKNQKDILIGTLLGDATIATRAGKVRLPILRIKFEQQVKFRTYIYHLYEVFKDFIISGPAVRLEKGTKTKISYWVATRQQKCFKYYYDLFYPKSNFKKSLNLYPRFLYPCFFEEDSEMNAKGQNRQKRVPKQINKLLTARALAYWFMDDGTHKVTKAGTIVYGLSTQGFNFSDQQLLVNALKKTFDLNVSIHKSGVYFKLYIKAESSQTFYNIIKPYVLPCFYYKLGISTKL